LEEKNSTAPALRCVPGRTISVAANLQDCSCPSQELSLARTC